MMMFYLTKGVEVNTLTGTYDKGKKGGTNKEGRRGGWGGVRKKTVAIFVPSGLCFVWCFRRRCLFACLFSFFFIVGYRIALWGGLEVLCFSPTQQSHVVFCCSI